MGIGMSFFNRNLGSFVTKSATAVLLTSTLTFVGVTPATAQEGGGIASLFGQKQQSKILPVHQAFKVNVIQKDNALVVTFNITPEHYIYKDKLTVVLPEGVSAQEWQFNSTPTSVDDPEFGRVLVFEKDVVATLPLTNKSGDIKNAPVSLRWQGCAKAGLCYPPEVIETTITLAPPQQKLAKPTPTPQVNQVTPPVQTATTPVAKTATIDEPKSVLTAPTPDKAATIVSPATPTPTTNHEQEVLAETTTQNEPSSATQSANEPALSPFETSPPQSTSSLEVQTVTTPAATDAISHTLTKDNDPFGINKHPILALFLLFLAGLLLSLTPCVYPMIPIVANIVARQNNVSSTKGLMLSGSYGLGVASAYGLLGALVAWFGQTIGIIGWLQNPYVLGVFALIFVVLALAMFDVLKIGLPAFVNNTLQQKSQAADSKLGSVGGSFLVGALSALVVSPCVSLPMAGALTAVSASESVLFGFLALFMLGLGLSLPLMLMGAIQGKFMPKAGTWMNAVKEFCGLLLLAVAVSLLERIFVSSAMLVIWALWFALMACWLWKLNRLPSQALAIVKAVWSVCLIIGAATGHTDAWQPLAKLATTAAVTAPQSQPPLKVTTLAQLDEILASHDKVLVDVTADWCIECRIMERELFANPPSALAQYQVVKLDITQTNEHSRAVLARYELVGPPTLLFYKNSQLVDKMLGSVERTDFERALSAL